jgi:hypothetical protein
MDGRRKEETNTIIFLGSESNQINIFLVKCINYFTLQTNVDILASNNF